MRIGCCVNMLAKDAGAIGTDFIGKLAAHGFDYIELPIAQIMALHEKEFQALLEQVHSSGVPCEACNNFFPPSVRLTGPDVDEATIRSYAAKAIERIEALGAKSVVFGSSGAKNVPEGFSHAVAMSQIVRALRIVDDLLGDRDIQVAVEPLCKRESNIINTAREGLDLVRAVSRPHIRLLVDYYHLSVEQEGLEIIGEAREFLQHMHIANPTGRVYPAQGDGVDYAAFLGALRGAGYDSRVSIEAFTDDFDYTATQAVAVVRAAAL